MIPFQQAYGLIIVMGFLILAGNTAFPILCVALALLPRSRLD